jgi:hypothetical protein
LTIIGDATIQANSNNKITLETKNVKEGIKRLVRHDTALSSVMPNDTIIINYQTMDTDCENAGIPIVSEGPHIKTYNDSYHSIIENYNEIKNMEDWNLFTDNTKENI